ncbi:hypothetical protein H8959_002574 [Pygathrix nigripes]
MLIDPIGLYSWKPAEPFAPLATAWTGSRELSPSAFCPPSCQLWLLKRLPPATVCYTASGRGKGPRTFQIASSSKKLFVADGSLLSLGIKMAAEPAEDNCINFVTMKFIDNTLYFIAEDDENLESDYFGKLESKLSIIRNLNDQVLFIDQGNQPLFEDMTDSDCRDNAPRTIFIINMYKDSQPRGMAVAISVKCEKISTLSCENRIISFKEMNPPDNIKDTKSDIIFFQRSVPGHDNKMQFESSSYEGYFLACEKERDLYKLILKKKDELGDRSIMFTVQNED